MSLSLFLNETSMCIDITIALYHGCNVNYVKNYVKISEMSMNFQIIEAGIVILKFKSYADETDLLSIQSQSEMGRIK